MNPTISTLKALFAVSSNMCAFLGCNEQLVKRNILMGDVCHIRGEKPGSPRYDAAQTDEQRRAAENLILLCPNHHREIDADVENYSIETLSGMKADHECRATAVSAEEAAFWHRSFTNQEIVSVGQEGGFAARTMNFMLTGSSDLSRGIGSPIAERFVRLFEMHGIHRNQIPRVLGRGLRLADVRDDAALLEALDTNILKAASDFFCINLDWLEGATDQIYPLHDFYKKEDRFERFVRELARRANGCTGVVMLAQANESEEDALIVIEEPIVDIDSKPIYRYHLCNNWLACYWKARGYLAACVAAAWRARIFLLGRKVSIDRIRELREGTTFLEYAHGSALPTEGLRWHPEDMLVKPEAFLDGVDEGVRGRRLGLQMWLDLERAGALKTDLPYVGVRERFERALAMLGEEEEEERVEDDGG